LTAVLILNTLKFIPIKYQLKLSYKVVFKSNLQTGSNLHFDKILNLRILILQYEKK